MNKHYEAAYKKINKYKLTKIQKAQVYKQVSDVLEEIDDSEINEVYLQEIINDVFELNEIPKVTKKVTYRFDSIFWGLIFIVTSFLLLFDPNHFVDFMVGYCVVFFIYFLIKRFYLLACVSVYFILTSTVLGGSWVALLAVVCLYIGIKIILFRPDHNMEYFNLDNKHRHHGYNPNHKYTENDVLFLDNKFNGTNLSFINEEITYIHLNNKFGGSELDFNKFEFLGGDLVININNKYGGLVLYVNEHTNVVPLVSNQFGATTTTGKEKLIEPTTNTIYVQGDNKFGGIEIKYS